MVCMSHESASLPRKGARIAICSTQIVPALQVTLQGCYKTTGGVHKETFGVRKAYAPLINVHNHSITDPSVRRVITRPTPALGLPTRTRPPFFALAWLKFVKLLFSLRNRQNCFSKVNHQRMLNRFYGSDQYEGTFFLERSNKQGVHTP